jgi:N-acetylglutamate synthase-like GNAT family acetyltransferase
MEDIRISTDKSELDRELIFNFLHNQARWCKGIPREIVEKSIQHSLCFGAYINSRQIGFARMVTDYATFGNLVDVFVVEELRGKGISSVILNAVSNHPELQGLRRITTATSEKQKLYAKFGFTELARPEIFMEKFYPMVYS